MDADSDNDGRGEVSRRQHYDRMSGDEFCGLNCFQLTWFGSLMAELDGGRSEFYVRGPLLYTKTSRLARQLRWSEAKASALHVNILFKPTPV